MSFDSDVQMKKSMISISQSNDLFAPNAESTTIMENNLIIPENKNDEHTQIVKELSLEEIDFEEPFSLKENKNNKIICSENNEEEKIDNFEEYRKKLMNVGKTLPLQTIQSDNLTVSNFCTENISISQWSKGDVVLNGKPLKVFIMHCFVLKEIYFGSYYLIFEQVNILIYFQSGVSIISDFLPETLEKNTLPKVEQASETLHSNHNIGIKCVTFIY